MQLPLCLQCGLDPVWPGDDYCLPCSGRPSPIDDEVQPMGFTQSTIWQYDPFKVYAGVNTTYVFPTSSHVVITDTPWPDYATSTTTVTNVTYKFSTELLLSDHDPLKYQSQILGSQPISKFVDQNGVLNATWSVKSK